MAGRAALVTGGSSGIGEATAKRLASEGASVCVNYYSNREAEAANTVAETARRNGAPKAITAMARKLACLFYRLIKHGQQYVDKGTEYYEARYREQQIRSLAKRAQKLGLQLVTPQAA